MTVRTYPEYLESGIDWVGQIPAHWQRLPLKRSLRFTTGWTPPTDRDDLYGGDNLWVTIGDMKEAVVKTTAKTVTNEAVQLGRCEVSPIGSLLFSFKLSIGQVGFSGTDLYTNEAIATFFQSRKVNLQYAYYMLPLFVCANAAENIYGAKLLNQDLIKNADLVLPPFAEQSAIAAFLDCETGKIDALVAEQERLIALLKEKRQAVISHTVTKGLNPNAPMKDSGVPWLGKIPANWEVVPLMRLTQVKRPIMYGIVLPGPDVGEGVPILKGGNVKPARMNLDSMARTTLEIEAPYARSRLMTNDLVYSIRGTIGDCEIVPNALKGSNITQDVARVAPDQSVNPEWLRFALLAKPLQEDLACGSLGAAVRGINIFDLKRVRVPVPPSGERVLIANYLRASINQIEQLVTEVTHAITLLRERRAALISAAVTGKIDVRGTVPAMQNVA